ncbi:MAG: GNAT family N-acetyltransferase [Patescibacteria group bacterium]
MSVQKAGIPTGGEVKRDVTNAAIRGLTEKDFPDIMSIERIVFGNEPDLIYGVNTTRVIREQNGFRYSLVYTAGSVELRRKGGVMGYLVAVEPEPGMIYLYDFAVIPSLQGRGIGWELFQLFATLLLVRAREGKESVFLDMHLRAETSAPFMEKHALELHDMGIVLRERQNLFDHYGPGKDAEYHKYEVVLHQDEA